MHSSPILRLTTRMAVNRYPDAKLDTMDVWDDVIDSRIVFMENLDRLTGTANVGSLLLSRRLISM